MNDRPGRKLILLDGHSLAYRAFFALPDSLQARDGTVTNAVYGFTTMLLRLLEEEAPHAAAVAFDKGEPTFRLEVFEAYKAQRPGVPDKLRPQFGLIKEVLGALGVAIAEAEGYEADDVLGTLARQAEADGWNVLLVTGDVDALQLVSDRVRVMITRRGISETVVYDPEAVERDYGVGPHQIPDLKGLMGDASDNIPGVPGVGKKTAADLVRRFGSVESLLEHVDAVPRPKLREALEEHGDQARLAKRLATIDTRMPLDLGPEDCRLTTPDYRRLYELFRALGFRSLIKRLDLESKLPREALEQPTLFAREVPGPGEGPNGEAAEEDAEEATGGADGPGEAGGGQAPVQFQVIREADELGAVAADLAGQHVVSVLLTLNGPDAMRAGIDTLSVGHAANGGILVRHVATASRPDGEAGPEEPSAEVLVAALNPVLAAPQPKKLMHDAKPAIMALRRLGSGLGGLEFDTAIAAYLLDPGRYGYDLPKLALEFLEVELAEEPPERPADRAGHWAARAGVIWHLARVMEGRLREAGLDSLFREVELPLVQVLADLEQRGFAVDRETLDRLADDFASRIEALAWEVWDLAGEEFNLNSTRQLATILFEKLKLPPGKRTKTGYSTDAEVLEQLAREHVICRKILEHREVAKLKSTYVDGLRELINPDTGRVHTTFDQTVAATGRLSSRNPNLQNIPVRTELGRQIRRAFVPGRPGWVILAADYSQIELRVLAHVSGDPVLLDAFKKGEDIHRRTAAEVFGVPLEKVTPEQRDRAKAVNFGIAYGQTDYGLSRSLGISREEAAAIIAGYFARYRGVEAYIRRTIAEARQQGFVTTLLGRRRYLPDIHSRNPALRQFAERTAVNTPIQGSAADIIKLAMVRADREIRAAGLQAQMILQVHDELVFEGPEAERDDAARLVRRCMEEAYPLDVPLVVDLKAGPNWADVAEFEPGDGHET